MSDLAKYISGMGWFGFAILSAVFAALTNIFGKIGVADIPSNMATLVRIAVILVITIGIVLVRGEWLNPAQLPLKTATFLVLSGCATGLSWLCYYYALKVGQAAQVGPVDKLSVVLVMLMGVAFLGEKLTARQWLGGAAILLGVILIAIPATKTAVNETGTVQAKSEK